MSLLEFHRMPRSLIMRELRVRIDKKGFRARQFVVVTSLLDPVAYPAKELAGLYRARWHAELDIRSIKCLMQMDVLRCKTPEMVRKEIWAHALVYNLIRGVMAEAADRRGVQPRPQLPGGPPGHQGVPRGAGDGLGGSCRGAEGGRPGGDRR